MSLVYTILLQAIESSSQTGFSNFANWITVIGFPLTIIGLIMTYCQGKKAKNAAEAAKTSASTTAKKMESMISIEKITKIIEHLNGCEGLLYQSNWEEVIFHIKTAKIELISLQKNGTYKTVNDSNFRSLCRDFQIDIDNLRQKINGDDFEPDTTIINKHIDGAIEIFTLIQTEVKNRHQHA